MHNRVKLDALKFAVSDNSRSSSLHSEPKLNSFGLDSMQLPVPVVQCTLEYYSTFELRLLYC